MANGLFISKNPAAQAFTESVNQEQAFQARQAELDAARQEREAKAAETAASQAALSGIFGSKPPPPQKKRVVRNPPKQRAQAIREAAAAGKPGSVMAKPPVHVSQVVPAGMQPRGAQPAAAPAVQQPAGQPAAPTAGQVPAAMPAAPRYSRTEHLFELARQMYMHDQYDRAQELFSAYTEANQKQQEEGMDRVMGLLDKGAWQEAQRLAQWYGLKLPQEFWTNSEMQAVYGLVNDMTKFYQNPAEKAQFTQAVIGLVQQGIPAHAAVSQALAMVPPSTKGVIKEGAEGFVNVSPYTGQAQPVTTAGGQPVMGKALPPGGIMVDLPGGGRIAYGGANQKSTQGKLEAAIIRASDGLQRLRQIEATYAPEFLTRWSKAKMLAWEEAERWGYPLDQQTRQDMARFTYFKTDTMHNLSLTLNELSGAAISPHEYERLKQSAPQMGDSPTVFLAKLQRVIFGVRLSIARTRMLRAQGVDFANIADDMVGDALQSFMPLGQVQANVEQEARELYDQFAQQPELASQPDQIPNLVDDAMRAKYGFAPSEMPPDMGLIL